MTGAKGASFLERIEDNAFHLGGSASPEANGRAIRLNRNRRRGWVSTIRPLTHMLA
jgi:hypothetical protein